MSQTSISDYFITRKRPAKDDIVSNKVRLLESGVKEKIEVFGDSPKTTPAPKTAPKIARKTPKIAKRTLKKDEKQGDIRRALLPSFQNDVGDTEKESEPVVTPEKTLISCFKTPEKKVPSTPDKTPRKIVSINEIVKEIHSDRTTTSEIKDPEVSEVPKLQRKDLGLPDIKAKLKTSPRLSKLKDALDRVNQSRTKLKEIEAKNEKSPVLKKFDKIEIEVPLSPRKQFSPQKQFMDAKSPSLLRTAIFKSPSKYAPGQMPYVSPRKLFTSPQKTSPVKSPTFQRYYSLASSGSATLILPYKYRVLAEMFRSVDTIVSMMFNRKETVYFEKLKTSVQQMSKKNLNESILGQIKTVFPDSFTFTREKKRSMPNHPEKYDLVVLPILNGEHLGPSVLLERRRLFYKNLLETTKRHHEDFMKSLNPPIVIENDKLTRWHPEFEVDSCPDIPAADLPPQPETEKASMSAKDVLSKAREIIGGNTRMEKALEKLAEKKDKPTSSAASQAIPGLAQALRGIPKSLLEKVRARQAAKAAELITRPPEETQRRLQLTRLPEIARILLHLFTLERKNVLSKFTVMEKIRSSHTEQFSSEQLEKHLCLLKNLLPDWINIYEIDGDSYVKIARDADMSKIMKRLQDQISRNQIDL